MTLEFPWSLVLLSGIVGCIVSCYIYVLGSKLLRCVERSARWRKTIPTPFRENGKRPSSMLFTGRDVFRAREERRHSERRNWGERVPVTLQTSNGEREISKGHVHDRSPTGLGLTMDREVAPGTVLQLRNCLTPGETSSIGVEVRHCKAQADAWRVGCLFTKKYPWSVLLLYG
jgi:hypothetical protein